MQHQYLGFTATSLYILMFVPCIARLSINNQHYALDYINSLFNMQAPTCFGSRVVCSGSFLDPCDLIEKQNNYQHSHAHSLSHLLTNKLLHTLRLSHTCSHTLTQTHKYTPTLKNLLSFAHSNTIHKHTIK
jgi:hypothetical protein